MTEIVKSNKLASIAFLFSIFAILGSGFLYYVDNNANKLLSQKIDSLSKKTDVLVSANTINQANFNDTLKNFDTRIKALSGNQNSVLIFQINQLISLANQGLIVYGNVSGAIRLLNNVLNILQSNNDPLFTSIKFAIASDIQKLDASSNVDEIIINSKLMNISNLLSSLSINNQQGLANQNNETKLHKFLWNIKTSILDFIKVKRNDVISTPEEFDFAINSIKIDLIGAKLSLFERDDVGYKSNLKNARQSLNVNFANYRGFEQIDSKIAELQNININNSDISINATIKELNNLTKLN